VDKGGRRFGFVKFLEVQEVEALSQRMQDVWIGSFLLRVNKSRFNRNEESKRSDILAQPVQKILREEGEGSIQQGRSFKSALVKHHGVLEDRDTLLAVPEEVLQVEVDDLVLKELEKSYVGVLAIDVEVRHIKTTLYMEGFAHISVTDMGRNKVLLFSPKSGELEALCKARTDWLCYYFKEVKPWSPSNFVDRRVTWVKVFGIPLHVWGESLFKAIGGKYGEFFDFDESTTSRAKLDVARIKISTSFRGCIDDPVKIQALGSVFTIWIVEDKGLQPAFLHGSRFEEHECSWVESTNFPAEAMELGRQDCGGSLGVEEDDDRVDPLASQHHVDRELKHGNGDVSLGEVGIDQHQLCVSVNKVVAISGNKIQTSVRPETFVAAEDQVGRSLCDMEAKGDSFVGPNADGQGVTAMCLVGEVEKFGGGPEVLQSVHVEGLLWVPGLEVERAKFKFRSKSLPPNCAIGLSTARGENLCSERKTKETWGRSVSAKISVPKFIQLAEAVRESGVKQRRNRKAVVVHSCSDYGGDATQSSSVRGGKECSVVHDSSNGSILSLFCRGVDADAAKLLHIQKQVGFRYEDLDYDVVKVLVEDENRDRKKKADWEIRSGHQ
ncbi:DUF4283 domain protein, partial [Trifolium medium]|nr:DUF4283 domain protein [Trifolium medium]